MRYILLFICAIFIIHCSKDSGQRIPIRRASGQDGQQQPGREFSKLPPLKDNNSGKTCLNLDRLLNEQIPTQPRSKLLVYTSDLRFLAEDNISGLNLNDHESLKLEAAQSNLVLINLKEDITLPFIEVDFAQNIYTEVPNRLAPFHIVKKSQNNCSTIKAQFFDKNKSVQEYLIGDESNEFQLIIKAKDNSEVFKFVVIGNQLQFTSYIIGRERAECDKSSSEKDYLIRTVINYEWDSSKDNAIEISAVFANSLKNLLSKKTNSSSSHERLIPAEFERSLSANPVTDTLRIKVEKDDYRRILKQILRSQLDLECRS